MFYFNTLPKVITPDQNGNAVVLTNIMSRASLIQELENNPMLFYTYNIQDGDTPEIVAEKYYGSAYAYWVVLHSNQILDPLWDWPLTDTLLNSYLDSKYAAAAALASQTPYEYVNSTLYGYRKNTTTTDNYSGVSTTETSYIDEDTYNSLIEITGTYTVGGKTCTIAITKDTVTIYEYEQEQNEAKREIKLLDKTYLGQMEAQLKTLMGT